MKDKIIYWLDDGVDMIPLFTKPKVIRNNCQLKKEKWQYVGYYENHGFTKKELKDLNMTGYIPAGFVPVIKRTEVIKNVNS
tara:strand:+ start:187 stop:429 length:243 start_codon:yes stop_codon:yes gene_type:complete